VGRTYDLPPTRPGGSVYVCDWMDEKELRKTPPTDPDQKVTYKVGAVELRIPLRYLSPFEWRDVPIEPRNRSELVPIPGQLHGGTWFAYKNWPRRVQAVMQVRNESGGPFVVSCHWIEFNKPVPEGWQPTLEGVEALTGAPRSDCRTVFALTPVLDADVTFGAKNISDWRAIRTELRTLVPQWQTPTNSSSTTQIKPP
jgi:hypothetical protein